MYRITLDQMMNDSDFPLFTNQSAIKILAACAWGKWKQCPVQGLKQYDLLDLFNRQGLAQSVKRELDVLGNPPEDYAERSEVLEWLHWLECAALAYQSLQTMTNQWPKDSDASFSLLQDVLATFLHQQEKKLSSRRDLWLYVHEGRKAQAVLEQLVFPWVWIRRHAEIDKDALASPEQDLAYRVLSDWMHGELTDEYDDAIVAILEQSSENGSLRDHYREILLYSCGEIELPIPEKGSPKNDEKLVAQWRVPHYGRGACISVWLRNNRLEFIFPGGKTETTPMNEAALYWEDPLLGSFETQIVHHHLDFASSLEFFIEEMVQQRYSSSKQHKKTALQTAIQYMNDPRIFEAKGRAMKRIQQDQSPNEDDIALLDTIFRLRIELERQAQELCDDRVESDLAYLDHLYHKKNMDDVFRLLNLEDCAVYAEGVELVPNAWWGQFQGVQDWEEYTLPHLAEALASMSVKKEWREMPPLEGLAADVEPEPVVENTPENATDTQRPIYLTETSSGEVEKETWWTQIEKAVNNLAQDIQLGLQVMVSLPQPEHVFIGKADTKLSYKRIYWKGVQDSSWIAQLDLPTEDTQNPLTLVIFDPPPQTKYACLLGVKRELKDDDPYTFTAQFNLKELRDAQKAHELVSLIILSEKGLVDFGVSE